MYVKIFFCKQWRNCGWRWDNKTQFQKYCLPLYLIGNSSIRITLQQVFVPLASILDSFFINTCGAVAFVGALEFDFFFIYCFCWSLASAVFQFSDVNFLHQRSGFNNRFIRTFTEFTYHILPFGFISYTCAKVLSKILFHELQHQSS